MPPTPGPSSHAPSTSRAKQRSVTEAPESPVIPTSSLAAPPLTSMTNEVEDALPAKRVSFYVEVRDLYPVLTFVVFLGGWKLMFGLGDVVGGQAVEDMIKGVLVKESHLFTDLEKRAMNRLLELSCKSSLDIFRGSPLALAKIIPIDPLNFQTNRNIYSLDCTCANSLGFEDQPCTSLMALRKSLEGGKRLRMSGKLWRACGS